MKSKLLSLIFVLLISISLLHSEEKTEKFSNYKNYIVQKSSVIVNTVSGQKLRITPYGENMVRVQAVRNNEIFYSDDHYETIVNHSWNNKFKIEEKDDELLLFTQNVKVVIKKNPVRLEFFDKTNNKKLLSDADGINWQENRIDVDFKSDIKENFCGLGHGYFAEDMTSINLRGKKFERNYATKHMQQAPLLVPFYLSGKGYGMFMNSTFSNRFNFGSDDKYTFGIDDSGFNGRMDYVFIFGPEFRNILDLYTQLTGRPRLPQLSLFGLQLSDKVHDHYHHDPSDEKWWKEKITNHRKLGLAFDHIVNDNRWRAGGGKRCESYFDWDSERYPSPKEYNNWLVKNGLTITLDYNRCIGPMSAGYKPEYQIPVANEETPFKESAIDLTNPEVRNWWWTLFWDKAINPELEYPCDGLWIDEFDEYGGVTDSTILTNGLSWAEMKNYWFYLIAKTLGQQGWDKDVAPVKRPYIWIRGGSAGGQRYATLWSGDIYCKYDWMETQVRALQSAGLSGYSFWGHDAGGFYAGPIEEHPKDSLYVQWSLGWGSFCPMWKPHGRGISRWPADRNIEMQTYAKKYIEMRYELLPYIYSYAHKAAETGLPLARAMVIDYYDNKNAWKYDLQYMYGENILVAPDCSNGNKKINIWLPKGDWYYFWNNQKYNGDKEIKLNSKFGEVPLFVKAGSIIPKYNYALSTKFINKDTLTIDIYSGADGVFELIEDDGVSEYYKTGQKMITEISYNDNLGKIIISGSKGEYKDSPNNRTYFINIHCGDKKEVLVNDNILRKSSITYYSKQDDSYIWDENNKTLKIKVEAKDISKEIEISIR